MAQEEIQINNLILHILDNNMDIPVLSEEEHPLTDDILEFINKHIMKVFNDGSLRPAKFDKETRIKEICENLAGSTGDFIDYTKELSTKLFNIIKSNPDIPSADIMFSIFLYENTRYLGIFKMNYRTSYIHYVDQVDNKNINSIVKQKTSLPNEKQKIDECILINLSTMDIKLIEKQYEINGEKCYYLSKLFLESVSKMSEKEKVKILNKTTKKFVEEHLSGDYEKVGEVKKSVAASLEYDEEVDIENIANNIFKNNVEMKKEFVDSMEREGLEDKKIKIGEKTHKRNFRKQKIVTDTGIEINVPVEFFNDEERIEFVNNVDGTISIVLKKIGDLKNK